MPDACLEPQVYNARRHGCDLEALRMIRRTDWNSLALPASVLATGGLRPDAVRVA